MTNPIRDELLQTLWHGQDPFADYAAPLEPDLQGWRSSHAYLKEAIPKYPERCVVIEIGVWKGLSSLTMAQELQRRKIPGAVICVDTWLGSWDHWTKQDGKWLEHLHFRNGYPNLYHTFASNVISEKVGDHIVPLPLDSVNAAHVIDRKAIRPNVIHIDGGHDYEAVKTDIGIWWPLLSPGGTLLGDDYHTTGGWPGVRKAFDEFFGKMPGIKFEHTGGKCRIVKPN